MKLYLKIRQAYTFSGDAIGYYAQTNQGEDGPLVWRGRVVYQDAYTAKMETLAYLVKYEGVPLFEWEDVQEEDTLPADVFAYAWIEKGPK